MLVLEDMDIIMELQQLQDTCLLCKPENCQPTVRSIRDVYLAEVNVRIKLGESGAITNLPEKSMDDVSQMGST